MQNTYCKNDGCPNSLHGSNTTFERYDEFIQLKTLKLTVWYGYYCHDCGETWQEKHVYSLTLLEIVPESETHNDADE